MVPRGRFLAVLATSRTVDESQAGLIAVTADLRLAVDVANQREQEGDRVAETFDDLGHDEPPAKEAPFVQADGHEARDGHDREQNGEDEQCGQHFVSPFVKVVQHSAAGESNPGVPFGGLLSASDFVVAFDHTAHKGFEALHQESLDRSHFVSPFLVSFAIT